LISKLPAALQWWLGDDVRKKQCCF
jgi:hypothetical protein